MLLQSSIFSLEYPFERISAAIGSMSTIRCGIHSRIIAKFSAHHLIYATSTLVEVKSNDFAVLQVQDSIFN
jgi:hypothetical protein